VEHSKRSKGLHITKASFMICDLTRFSPFCHAVLSDEVPLVVSRQLLHVLAQEVSKLALEVHKPVATM
jgi:hypothetical protein